jgi:hypothetical protein
VYPTAYDRDHLDELLNSNSSWPDYMSGAERDRLVKLARQRADARGGALDDGETECIIGTDWGNFASGEFGFDDDTMNQVALGVVQGDISSGKDATLFSDTVVVQDRWLCSGDGRLTATKDYEDEDWDDANIGDLWIPDGAQDYICIVALSGDIVHDDPDASEAM